MTDKHLIQPDMEFIKEVQELGGDTLKKCFQCATCSVACPISPDNKPFPRKEMIAASWGLKDRLVKSADIWMCHHCGDCTAKCPRGAKPGEVLAAVRSYAIADYAVPRSLGKFVNTPKNLPWLFVIPSIIFIVLGLLTGLLDFTPEGAELAHGNFFSTWLVDLIFIPCFIWMAAIFAIGLRKFLIDIHENAVAEGKTEKTDLNYLELGKAFLGILPTIMKHKKFSECSENSERATAHILVLYSFIGLFIVTNAFFFALYVLQIHGPYPQWIPFKWLGNFSGVALVIGGFLMMKSRMEKNEDQTSSYSDWYLLGLVFGLGLTGLLTEMTRLGDLAFLTYLLYFIHLIFVFNMFAFLPFTKFAHLFYRTVALTYVEYSGRK